MSEGESGQNSVYGTLRLESGLKPTLIVTGTVDMHRDSRRQCQQKPTQKRNGISVRSETATKIFSAAKRVSPADTSWAPRLRGSSFSSKSLAKFISLIFHITH
ncbi:hypothetical protein PGT21_025693 [Puccinia graminis f. sp. tritici]|uniref:Uncharacterized protein n=1 Tax=Puccinia graminis f. sp. tritici TaxID=56615 RepID=A0A5B0QPK1_PUCGR|nr:hypothetical protein PGT21_025693 [Puccinia graminis f. sp. tritici]